MSTTQTQTQTHTESEPTSIREILRTYDTLHTGQPGGVQQQPEGEEEESSTELQAQQAQLRQSAPDTVSLSPSQAQSHAQPQDWPSDWHSTPPYRPTSRSHRVADRAAGVDNTEAVMVVAMFAGVYIQGNLNRLWRATVGRWNDQIMRYKVGGEW